MRLYHILQKSQIEIQFSTLCTLCMLFLSLCSVQSMPCIPYTADAGPKSVSQFQFFKFPWGFKCLIMPNNMVCFIQILPLNLYNQRRHNQQLPTSICLFKGKKKKQKQTNGKLQKITTPTSKTNIQHILSSGEIHFSP